MARGKPGLTEQDLAGLRAQLAEGKRPRVQLSGPHFPVDTAGTVVRVGSPEVDGADFVRVRVRVNNMTDELAFAPGELSVRGRGGKAAGTKKAALPRTAPAPSTTTAPRTTAAPKIAPSGATVTPKTAPSGAVASTGGTAPLAEDPAHERNAAGTKAPAPTSEAAAPEAKVTAARAAAPAPGTTTSARRSATTAQRSAASTRRSAAPAASAAPARKASAAAESLPASHPARRRKAAPAPAVTVTLASSGPAWTLSVTRGAKSLAKNVPLPPGVVTAVADLLDQPALSAAVSEINDVALAEAQARAEQLRAELDQLEAVLATHRAPAGRRSRTS